MSPTLAFDDGAEPVPTSTRAPTHPPPLVGRTLGTNYKVIEQIGSGGMGIVYLVEHTSLRKRFAAKVLSHELASNPEAIARFEIEAHAASQLEHDNVVNVIDYGKSEDGAVFLVMEHLRGKTLQARMDEQPLSLEEVVTIIVQVCHALGAAHAAGIVHRDMKPENIFLITKQPGRPLVKVLDFGISKARESSLGEGRITKQGQVLGSPEYMSPEASRGDEVDSRADIYAVGILLYELLCGQVPFRHENYLKVLQKHATEQPRSPRELRPDLPEAVETVLARALAKNPDERHQTVEELEQELLDAMPDVSQRVLIPTHTPAHGIYLRTPPGGMPAVTPSGLALPNTTPGGMTPGAMTPAAMTPASFSASDLVPTQPIGKPSPIDLPRVGTPRVKKSRMPLVLALIGAAVAAGATFAIMANRGDQSSRGTTPPAKTAGVAPAAGAGAAVGAQPAPPVAGTEAPPVAGTEAPPVAAPAAAKEVRLRVDSTPRGATVSLDGRVLGKTPLDRTVPRSQKAAQLRIQLAGHRPVGRRVDLRRDVDLRLPMKQIASSSPEPTPDLDIKEGR